MRSKKRKVTRRSIHRRSNVRRSRRVSRRRVSRRRVSRRRVSRRRVPIKSTRRRISRRRSRGRRNKQRGGEKLTITVTKAGETISRSGNYGLVSKGGLGIVINDVVEEGKTAVKITQIHLGMHKIDDPNCLQLNDVITKVGLGSAELEEVNSKGAILKFLKERGGTATHIVFEVERTSFFFTPEFPEFPELTYQYPPEIGYNKAVNIKCVRYAAIKRMTGQFSDEQLESNAEEAKLADEIRRKINVRCSEETTIYENSDRAKELGKLDAGKIITVLDYSPDDVSDEEKKMGFMMKIGPIAGFPNGGWVMDYLEQSRFPEVKSPHTPPNLTIGQKWIISPKTMDLHLFSFGTVGGKFHNIDFKFGEKSEVTIIDIIAPREGVDTDPKIIIVIHNKKSSNPLIVGALQHGTSQNIEYLTLRGGRRDIFVTNPDGVYVRFDIQCMGWDPNVTQLRQDYINNQAIISFMREANRIADKKERTSTEKGSKDKPTDFQGTLPSESGKTYYETLGISKDAAIGDIKKAYHAIALKNHPDKSDAAEAAELFKVASEAWEVLSDGELRAYYDSHIE